MTRRTLLECSLRLAAMPAGLQFLSQWSRAAQAHTHGAAAPADPDYFSSYQPQFFSVEDFRALQSLTEMLIPTDETPGAREAHCAAFIDFVLHSNIDAAPETTKQWRVAMQAFNDAGFRSANATGRAKLLAEIAKPETDSSAHHPAFAAYRLIKRENAFAFYTARAGLIDALDYRGNSFNVQFPGCTHPEHQWV